MEVPGISAGGNDSVAGKRTEKKLSGWRFPARGRRTSRAMAPLQVIFAGFCSAAAVLSVQFFVLTNDRLLLLFGGVIAAGALVQIPLHGLAELVPAIAAFLAAQAAFAWTVLRNPASDRRLFWAGYASSCVFTATALAARLSHPDLARTLFETGVLAQAALLAFGISLRYAQLDPLTGVKSRAIFDRRLASSWRRARRDAHGLAVILVAAEGIRRYERQYGRLAADTMLRQIASLCMGCCRSRADVLARYGDESFAAIVPRVSRAQADEIAERMFATVSQGCTLPIGIGVSSIENAVSSEALLQQAARRSARHAIANAGAIA